MVAYFLGYAYVGTEIGPVAVLSKGVGVGGFEYEALELGVGGFGICERVRVPVQVHIGYWSYGSVAVASINVASGRLYAGFAAGVGVGAAIKFRDIAAESKQGHLKPAGDNEPDAGYVGDGRMDAFSLTQRNTRLWGYIFIGSLMLYFPLTGLGSLLPLFVGGIDGESLRASCIGFLANDAFRGSLLSVFGSLQRFFFMLMIVCTLLFAFYYTPVQHVMRWLMPYGRMSLTNYVTQSIIGSFLFYHWGLHLPI